MYFPDRCVRTLRTLYVYATGPQCNKQYTTDWL